MRCPSSDIDAEVEGRFTEDCVRQYVTWGFRVPHPAEYDSPAFRFSPRDPSGLIVYYSPMSVELKPYLFLEVFPSDRGLSIGWTEYVTTPRGFEVKMGRDPIGFGGAWDDGDAFYVLDVVDGSDTPENRAIILESADLVLAAATETP